MGGWVVAHTAAHDHALIGAILISAGDMGRLGEESPDRLVAEMADNMEGLSGVTAQSMADEDRANAKDFHMENAAAGLTQTPLLVLTSNDGLAPDSDALVNAIEAKGGHKIKVIHVATDHGWSDHRIALESAILTWLSSIVAPAGAYMKLVAANRHLVRHTRRGDMLVYRVMAQPRVFVADFVHLAPVRRTGDRDRAREHDRRQTQNSASYLQGLHEKFLPQSYVFVLDITNTERKRLTMDPAATISKVMYFRLSDTNRTSGIPHHCSNAYNERSDKP